MKTAEHRVQFVGTRDRHCGPDRVEHAAMATGGNDDEAPPLYDITGGMLIGMPVRDELPAPLIRREVIDRGRLDQSIGQYPLERLPRDVAGGEWALQCARGVAAHGRDPRGLKCRAVERTPGA